MIVFRVPRWGFYFCPSADGRGVLAHVGPFIAAFTP